MALTKLAALEYLTEKQEPITAKELAIDLDSRASTASELLERMTAQGLVHRDPKQRPREYVLTEAGRKCLEDSRATENVTNFGTGSNSTPKYNGTEEHPSEADNLMVKRTDAIRDVNSDCSREVDSLYRARHEFVARSWFSAKDDLQKKITALESQVGPHTAKQIEQLVKLERDLLRDHDHVYLTALQLRMQLSLAPEVFTRASAP